MPFLKFGENKGGEDDELEAPEDSGLLMSTKGDQPGPAGESAPEPASPEPLEELDPGGIEGQTADAETSEGEAAEEGDPLPEAALADPTAEEESAADAPGDAEGSGEADAGDLMAAFHDDESYGEIADLVKDVEEVAASSLLEELREIRLKLPQEALDQGESVA